VLRVVVSAVPSGGGVKVAAAVLADGGRVVRAFAGVRAEDDAAGAAMSAVLRVLWTARGAGKSVLVYVDPPEVAEWLARRVRVDDRHLATYVQVRALSHAYRHVEFLPAGRGELDLLRRVAQERPRGGPDRGADLLEPVGQA
jgi:hypothetical protein